MRSVPGKMCHDALVMDPVPVDEALADAWAGLRLALRAAGLRMPVNHSWITAIALGATARIGPCLVT